MKKIALVVLLALVCSIAYGQTQVLSRNAVGYVKILGEKGKLTLGRSDFEAMDAAGNLTMAHYREAITNAPDLDEKSRQALEAVYQPSPEQSAAMSHSDMPPDNFG